MRRLGNEIFELSMASGVDPVKGTAVNTGRWIGMIVVKACQIDTLKEDDKTLADFDDFEIDSGITFYSRNLITSIKLKSGAVLMIRIV